MIEIPLKDGTVWKVPMHFRLQLGETYNDVDDELMKMRMWCLANPNKCKTQTGIRRFIVNWLNKSGKVRPRTVPNAILEARAKPITDADRERAKGHIANLKGMLKR